MDMKMLPKELQQLVGGEIDTSDPNVLTELMAGTSKEGSVESDPLAALQAGMKLDAEPEVVMQILEAFQNMPPEMQQQIIADAKGMIDKEVSAEDEVLKSMDEDKD